MNSLYVDHIQRRLSADRLSVFAGGKDFDTTTASNIWIEPITKTILLRPGFFTQEWVESNSGIYAKLPTSTYIVDTPGAWKEVADAVIAGPWSFIPDSSFNEPAITSAYMGKNQGMYMALYVPGVANNNVEKVRFGFGETADVNNNWGFILYTNGDIETYYEGTLIANGSITSSDVSESIMGNVIELAIIPYRKRDLLIYSPSNGGGFYVTNETIAEDALDADILGSSKFWFHVTNGVTKVMTSTIKYFSSGSIESNLLSFFEPPLISDVLDEYPNVEFSSTNNFLFYAHPSYNATHTMNVQLLGEDGLPFVKNGVNTKCKLKISMDSDNSNFTPSFYASLVSYKPRFSDTSNESYNISKQYQSIELNVGEQAKNVSLDVTLIDVENEVVDRLISLENRPIQFKSDTDIVLFDGVMKIDNYTENGVNPYVSSLNLNCLDYWHLLETYIFVDPIPLDGRKLTDAIKMIMQLVGFDEDKVVITESDYIIPYLPATESGEFSNLIEVGDTAASWITKLLEDYTDYYYYGFKPSITGIIFYAQSADDLGTTPKIVLYDSIQDSIDIGGHSEEDASKYVYQTYKELPLPIEANDIRVTGYNPQTRKAIHVHKVDYASQNPELTTTARPDNWLGFIKRYGILDVAFNTQDVCINVCNYLFDRLTTQRFVAEVNCKILLDSDGVPLWRGDIVHLYNKDKYYRINTFNVDFVKELEDFSYSTSKYTLSRPLDI